MSSCQLSEKRAFLTCISSDAGTAITICALSMHPTGSGSPPPASARKSAGQVASGSVRNGLAPFRSLIVMNAFPPNPQSGISAEAAPKCCLGVSLSIPASDSAAGFPAKFFDSGRKPIHAFGDLRLANG